MKEPTTNPESHLEEPRHIANRIRNAYTLTEAESILEQHTLEATLEARRDEIQTRINLYEEVDAEMYGLALRDLYRRLQVLKPCDCIYNDGACKEHAE